MTKLLFIRNLDGTREILWLGAHPWRVVFMTGRHA